MLLISISDLLSFHVAGTLFFPISLSLSAKNEHFSHATLNIDL